MNLLVWNHKVLRIFRKNLELNFKHYTFIYKLIYIILLIIDIKKELQYSFVGIYWKTSKFM